MQSDSPERNDVKFFSKPTISADLQSPDESLLLFKSYNVRLLVSVFIFVFQISYSNSQVNTDALRQKFSDTLLIINFNHPYYANIEFLKTLYSCFENIIFYGEKEADNVIALPTHTGFILSNVIYDACTRFPDYKGYLFLQDDCALHFWNMLHLDVEKIWYAVKFNDGKLTCDKFFSIVNTNGYLARGYPWGKWNMECCFSNASAAHKLLPPHYLSSLQANLGENNIAAQMCEVFYVPARLKNDFLQLNYIFKDVFCEVAVPTMLSCMDSIENWEQLSMFGGEGVGYDGFTGTALTNYPLDAHWVHPIKFSSPENRSRMLEIVNSVVK